ncbi:type II methionyl aminopeptidase [archaeon]|jgi:methionyl aminopeptidase|nr:type II methionyl aminopeptidase [archaeon]
MEKEKILLAGEITKKVKADAKDFIKKGMPLLEIAERIENKIVELGGKPAFPTNLSINNIAAHYTPFHEDKTLAEGLLKVDFGVHIDGWLSDNAFSLDLENSELNKKLIESSKNALKKALETIEIKKTTNEIGKVIEDTIQEKGFQPIRNLSGHSMDQYDLHAGITMPNIDDNSNIEIPGGLYAIEPFATTGSGKVHDGKPSGIYMIVDDKNIRSPIAREVLNFIIDEYQTIPFCERWIIKKVGAKALFGLRQLEQNGNLHQFKQLVEEKGALVSQAENTILLLESEKIITTE